MSSYTDKLPVLISELARKTLLINKIKSYILTALDAAQSLLEEGDKKEAISEMQKLKTYINNIKGD